MRLTAGSDPKLDLTASQAARLLREGRLGEIMVRRAIVQVERHNQAVAEAASAESDQARSLRRAVRAHGTGTSGAKASSDGAAA